MQSMQKWFNKMIKFEMVSGFSAYRVGSDGSVWSRWKSAGKGGVYRFGDWRLLTPGTDRDGYRYVILQESKRKRRVRVHVLVLETFVGPRPSIEHQACHYPDCTKTNNHLSNLVWGTPKENSKHCIEHGNRPSGSKHGRSKLTEADVKAIRAEEDKSHTELSKKFGVSATQIIRIRNGTNWPAQVAEADAEATP